MGVSHKLSLFISLFVINSNFTFFLKMTKSNLGWRRITCHFPGYGCFPWTFTFPFTFCHQFHFHFLFKNDKKKQFGLKENHLTQTFTFHFSFCHQFHFFFEKDKKQFGLKENHPPLPRIWGPLPHKFYLISLSPFICFSDCFVLRKMCIFSSDPGIPGVRSMGGQISNIAQGIVDPWYWGSDK